MTAKHRAASPRRRILLTMAGLVVVVAVTLGLTTWAWSLWRGDKPGPTTPSPSPSTSISASDSPSPTPSPSASAPDETHFAVIGDFGSGDKHEAAVATLVGSWDPQFVVGVGDVYYDEAGGTGSERYDKSVGAYYCRWLKGVTTTGTACPTGSADINRFFPALGNHDVKDAGPGPTTYLDYFDLPGEGHANSSGNERYYDVVEGPVHLFVLNSNPSEPDGITAGSAQAKWLKAQLAASTSPWNIVVAHHPPYSSDSAHGPTADLQWPFAQWGAQVVISGHAHTYERVERDGIVYFVNGLGGAELYAFGAESVTGSTFRYAQGWGAQRVTATPTSLTFDFHGVDGAVLDSRTLTKQ